MCLCVAECMNAVPVEIRVTSVPLPFHSQRLNSSGQAWQQALYLLRHLDGSGWVTVYECLPLFTKIKNKTVGQL